MSDQPNYAQGLWVYENEVGREGAKFIKQTLSGDAQKFCEWLMSIADDQGQFRLTMTRRRTQEKNKPSHNVYEDTYRANRDANPTPARTHEQPPQNYAAHTNPTYERAQNPQQSESTDNLPF